MMPGAAGTPSPDRRLPMFQQTQSVGGELAIHCTSRVCFPSVCLLVGLLAFLLAWLFVCLFVCLFACLFVCFFVCLFVCVC